MMTLWLGILISLGVAGACVWAFYELAEDFETSEAVARFDERADDWVDGWQRPWLTWIMKAFTYLGGIFGVAILTTVLFLVLIVLHRPAEARNTAMLVIGGTVIANGVKPFLKRVRPPEDEQLIEQPKSASFPSGHSMGSMCLAFAAIEAILAAPTVTTPIKVIVIIACLAYAVMVGLSRIYLGAHWPSDVLAAWLLAVAWVVGATGLNLLLTETTRVLEPIIGRALD